MVIDANDLDLDGVLYAIVGVGVGVLVSALAVAWVAARLGRHRLGFVSIVLGLVIAVALLVDVVVASRVVSGDVTGWDLLWAAGLTAAGVLCSRRLALAPHQADGRSRTS